MTNHRSFVAWTAALAMIATGCASSGTQPAPARRAPGAARAPAPKPADPKAATAPKPADTKAADAKAAEAKAAEAKAAEAKAAEKKAADAKAADAKAAEKKAAEKKATDAKAAEAKAAEKKAADAKAAAAKAPPPAAPPASEGGFIASYDDFMKRQGAKLAESKFLGLRLRPRFSDDLSYTDNVFYQDSNEKLVVNLDYPPNGINARPNLGKPRAKVKDFVNTATLGLDLDLPLNLALIPILGEGKDRFTLIGGSITSVEYFLDKDSPDAINYEFHADLPALINDMVSRLMKIDVARHALYFRGEGSYSVITDPLDVARLTPSAGGNPTFTNEGERNSFTRTEYFAKGTLGWRGPLFDSKISYRHYRMDLEDKSLQPADHTEREMYGEIGHHLRRSEHRIYGFYEHTKYNFDNRGYPDPNNPNEEDTIALRDFAKIRTGMGWEGPLLSKKIKGGAEVYYLATDVYHEGNYLTHPVATNIHDGSTVTFGGQPVHRRFDERGMVAGKANVTYRPFVTKGTQLQAEYERNVDFSVVAQDKVVDKGNITFTHPINDRLTGETSLTMMMENMQHREKRLYTEFGIGARYKLAAFTEVYLRYTYRHMRSRREPVTSQSDAANEEYLIKADGDFSANIVSIGITIQF